MNPDERIDCAFSLAESSSFGESKFEPFVLEQTRTGRLVNPVYADKVLLPPPVVPRIFVPVVTHTVVVPSAAGGVKPVVDREWIETAFGEANRVWDQACIRLNPHYSNVGIDAFRNLSLSAAFGTCLAPEQIDIVDPYEVTTGSEYVSLVNLFIVDQTNQRACGSPVTKRVFLPSSDLSGKLDPVLVGNTLAHELGHVVLNELLDDSENPNHLMFHASRYPDVPEGTRDGLFLSECLWAREVIQESIWHSTNPGGSPQPGGPYQSCQVRPKLGNNLALIEVSTAISG